jgi:citrate synthase
MEHEYLTYKLADTLKVSTRIDTELFSKYGVKRGLRNEDGSGVLVGLTNVGNVVGYQRDSAAKMLPIPGKLLYRGYDLEDLVHGAAADKRMGFEEVAYLLLAGDLPDADELAAFHNLLVTNMSLPHDLVISIIQRKGSSIMNALARTVLEMHTFDENADDLSRINAMEQSIRLIAQFPTIIAYAINSYRHLWNGLPLHVRLPDIKLSLAENFLYMTSKNYTELDARVLDLLLMLHAEHGGGNNSTFTVRVTSSTRTDIYSSIAAGIGSLNGPLHGGANIKVVDMFHHLQEAISSWDDEDEISAYLTRMLHKEVYDGSGLIYGIGHAVYTVSDPRALLLRKLAAELAAEKGRSGEFAFLERIERCALAIFDRSKNHKQMCANVDFYSGFVYELLGLPTEIFTPLFAMSRIAGWVAHRNEELNFTARRIIRPAFRNVIDETFPYVPLAAR